MCRLPDESGYLVTDFGFKVLYNDGRELFREGFESYYQAVCIASMMMDSDSSIELISIATKKNGIWSFAQ